MKNNLFLILIMGSSWIACTNNSDTNQTNNTQKDTAQTQAVAAPEQTSACYKYVSGKDSVLLYLTTLAGSAVTGELVYSFFEKDNNTGTFDGQMKGDTIFADYTFMSEGSESVREIALLKKGDDLVEGYGEVKEAGNKMVFVNKGALNFGSKTILKKTACMTDEHGCVGTVGYAWSTLKNNCIKPQQNGIQLNYAGNAKANAKSAFIVFSDGQKQAELFLPDTKASLLMERKGEEGSHFWENGTMKLYPWKGYVLKQNDKVVYAGQ